MIVFKIVLFLINNSGLFFFFLFILICFSTYVSFAEKHDRGELVWPCAGGCKGQIQTCATSLSLHQWMCLCSMSWKMTPSCRFSWCRCWWSTLGFRKPPSGLWNTMSPGISFPAGYGKRSRISHLISEWQHAHQPILGSKLCFAQAQVLTWTCLLLTTSFLALYVLLLSLLIHTSVAAQAEGVKSRFSLRNLWCF